jgi:hypothetical protein
MPRALGVASNRSFHSSSILRWESGGGKIDNRKRPEGLRELWAASRMQVEELSPANKPMLFFVNPPTSQTSFFFVRAFYFMYHNQMNCFKLYRSALIARTLSPRQMCVMVTVNEHHQNSLVTLLFLQRGVSPAPAGLEECDLCNDAQSCCFHSGNRIGHWCNFCRSATVETGCCASLRADPPPIAKRCLRYKLAIQNVVSFCSDVFLVQSLLNTLLSNMMSSPRGLSTLRSLKFVCTRSHDLLHVPNLLDFLSPGWFRFKQRLLHFLDPTLSDSEVVALLKHAGTSSDGSQVNYLKLARLPLE